MCSLLLGLKSMASSTGHGTLHVRQRHCRCSHGYHPPVQTRRTAPRPCPPPAPPAGSAASPRRASQRGCVQGPTSNGAPGVGGKKRGLVSWRLRGCRVHGDRIHPQGGGGTGRRPADSLCMQWCALNLPYQDWLESARPRSRECPCERPPPFCTKASRRRPIEGGGLRPAARRPRKHGTLCSQPAHRAPKGCV